MKHQYGDWMIDTGFSDRLKEARVKSGLTYDEIEKYTGVQSASLVNYERSKTMPLLCVVDALANLYNVSIDWLCGRE